MSEESSPVLQDDNPQPPQGGPVSATTGLAPNVAAGLTAIFPLVGGIIFLVLEKKDEFVRFWATQSLFFGAAFLVANIVLGVASFVPLIGCATSVLAILVSLAGVVLWLIGIVKAFQGEHWVMPFIGPIAEKQLAASTPPLTA